LQQSHAVLQIFADHGVETLLTMMWCVALLDDG
jgi:hypothetical protein